MSKDRLDSNVTIEGQPLKSVTGDSPDEIEILGYAVMYTAGSDWNVLVPRDWLVRRCQELGIDELVVPSEPRPSSAYKRAIKRLKEDAIDDEHFIELPRLDTQDRELHKVNLSVRDGDGHNVKHLYAEVFYDEKETGEEGGRWDDVHLGFFDYESDSQMVFARIDDGLTSGSEFAQLWAKYSSLVHEYYDDMLVTHIGLDIRLMMYQTTRQYTRTVMSLRDGGGVYFFPAGLTDFVDSMARLYSDINQQFKRGGGTMAVRTLPVLDSESEREWIEERVRETLEKSVKKVIDKAYEQVDQGAAHSEVLASIRQNLGEHAETAEMYNALLEAELDIDEMVSETRDSLSDEDKQELIDSVLEQTTITTD